jgi:hypothetical protein
VAVLLEVTYIYKAAGAWIGFLKFKVKICGHYILGFTH